MIRAPRPEETPALVSLAERTGLFTASEADALLRSTLDALHAGQLGEAHVSLVCAASLDSPPLGWTYFAESGHAPGVWDVWWIGVDPRTQRAGVGSELLTAIESWVRPRRARVLVIETSDQPLLTAARSFYHRRGYTECGRIPNFYALGDAKVIFAKTLAPS